MTRSVMSDSVTPLSVVFQAPLSMGLSRKEYWNGLPCLSPGDLPNPGIKPGSLALQTDSLSLGLPAGSDGKESTCNVGDLASIPGLGRSPGEGKGYPFYYSGLENSMDCIVHRVAKCQTRLSELHFCTP